MKPKEHNFFEVVKTKRPPRNDGSKSKKKFLGFDIYLQCNGKLSKKNREILLKESEEPLCEVTEYLLMGGKPMNEIMGLEVCSELDNTLDDNELLSDWNFAYENFGFVMSRFSSKWEKEYIKTSNQPKPEFQTLLQRIESLETRIGELEKEKMSRFKSIGF
jgi:hypothetical protein